MTNLTKIEISSTPLNNPKLYEAQGALLTSTDYSQLVSYVGGLYAQDPTADYFPQPIHEINYTTIGTLTNNDDVISGFSSSNYALLPDAFNPSGTWEQQWKFTTGASVSDYQRITGAEHDVHSGANLVLHNEKMQIWLTNSTGTWTINGGDSNENGNFVANTTYWVRVKYDGNKYVVSQSSDRQTFTDIITVNNPAKIYSAEPNTVGVGSLNGSPSPFQGSIDMNDCYIKEGNTITWHGAIKLDTPEEVWQKEVEETGTCGKFIYDGTNNTVRLPKYGNKLYTTENKSSNVYYYIQVKE